MAIPLASLQTPDEIVTQIPTLTLGDVHAALSYYFDHMDEIQAEMRSERLFAEEMQLVSGGEALMEPPHPAQD